MESILSDVVDPEELLKFEKNYNKEWAMGDVSKETEFHYAWCLIRSKCSEDIKKGVGLLEKLVQASSKDGSQDYLFYLSVGSYKVKEYQSARKYICSLLKNEPANSQALELHKLIDRAIKKEVLVGIGIVGGIGLAAVGLVSLVCLVLSRRATK